MRVIVVGAALVTSCALAACTDGPEPKFAAPSSTSTEPAEATASASPSTSPPSMPSNPPPATLTPEAAVRGWVEARNALLASGDASDVRQASGPDCATCTDLIQPIEDVYDSGGHIETRGWRVVEAVRDPAFSTSRIMVTKIRMLSGVAFASADADPEPFPANKRILNFTLAKTDGAWRIAKVVFPA